VGKESHEALVCSLLVIQTRKLLKTYLEEGWLNEMIEGNRNGKEHLKLCQEKLLLDPGHFRGSWNFFKGASVTVTELSFTKLGFPSIEFRASTDTLKEPQWTKLEKRIVGEPYVEPQESISGRSWYVCNLLPDTRDSRSILTGRFAPRVQP
jgi:hypothetical protein